MLPASWGLAPQIESVCDRLAAAAAVGYTAVSRTGRRGSPLRGAGLQLRPVSIISAWSGHDACAQDPMTAKGDLVCGRN